MTMTVGATHWYSQDFTVEEADRQLAHADVSSWGEKGVLTIDGVAHRVYREGISYGDFLLEREGRVLARATKPSAWRNRVLIRHGDRTYELDKRSIWTRSYVVRSGSTEVGTLAPTSSWRRTADASLPEEWPLPLKIFVIWLTVILWRRERSM